MWAEHIGSALGRLFRDEGYRWEEKACKNSEKKENSIALVDVMKLVKYWTDKTLHMDIHYTYIAALSFAVEWMVHHHSLLFGPK